MHSSPSLEHDFAGVSNLPSILNDDGGDKQGGGKTQKRKTHPTGFTEGEFIVYPAHGVGQLVTVEEQEVAGYKLELFVINFMQDKMVVKVPLSKVKAGAVRKVVSKAELKKALDVLAGRARAKRTMWSRRAQEYETKINSGDLMSIMEVVRDLYKPESLTEQSYSERQLYELALDRLLREVMAVQQIEEFSARELVVSYLQKGQKPKIIKSEESVVTTEAEVVAITQAQDAHIQAEDDMDMEYDLDLEDEDEDDEDEVAAA